VKTELGSIRRVAIANSLRASQIFSGLPRNDLESIASFTVQRRLGKGDYLFREGAPAEGFYIVQSGAINLHRVSALGKEQVICIFYPAQSFAEAALASETGYPANARAIESSNVLLIPKRDFLDLLRKRPELALRMLGMLSQHLRALVTLLDDLTLKDVEARLANWLLKHCPRPFTDTPAIVKLDCTKRVLASQFGTASETLSRTFAKLRDKRLIRMSGKTITVTKPRTLDELLRRHLAEL
jgi:CRP/FNR family transcriptional regulator